MNTKSILIAYASKYGSTQEVAETIGKGLSEAGFQVDLQPVTDVKSLDGYDAVVLGAAIYSTHWHPDAHAFLSKNREILERQPLAIFTLGPLSAGTSAMQSSRRQLDKELAKYSWLKPVASELFVGKYDPKKLTGFNRFVPASDHRDWVAICTWAYSLVGILNKTEVLA
jgi:menaquinone-dependent protoporphyrinogen oxidase